MWVLKHNETGKYVSRPGCKRSYTNDLDMARRFKSAEEAEKERCVGSETVIDLLDMIFKY